MVAGSESGPPPESNGVDSGRFTPRVISRIQAAIDELPRSQKVLALYMTQHPEKIGYLPIRELAAKAGVSLATVVRLCKHLGYEGYVELGQEVQQGIQYELTTLTRFGLGEEVARSNTQASRSTFERVVDVEREAVVAMLQDIRREDVDKCVNWMHQADRIISVGNMGSAALAEYFAYGASKIKKEVEIITSNAGPHSWFSNKKTGPDSLAVLFAFPRYPNATLEIGSWLKGKGVRIVAVTDGYRSPLVELADIVFTVSISFTTVVDAFTAPVAFLHGLIAEYSERYPEDTSQRLLEFEEYTRGVGIWSKSPTR